MKKREEEREENEDKKKDRRPTATVGKICLRRVLVETQENSVNGTSSSGSRSAQMGHFVFVLFCFGLPPTSHYPFVSRPANNRVNRGEEEE